MTAVGHLPNGSKGFDCNTRVSAQAAEKFRAAGYKFVVRYVRRALSVSKDITAGEMIDLLQAGLSVMLVQHVGLPGRWMPNRTLGSTYGQVAAEHAKKAGYPLGCTLWCDLEGVPRSSSSVDVIGYCNAWYDAVKAAGYFPGLYVGDSCGLSAKQLFHALKFQAYWAAYNLNRDQYPVVRGVQMQQGAYPKIGHRVDVPYEYDTNEIDADALGGSPFLCLPPFDV